MVEWKIESTSLSPVYRAPIPKTGPVEAKNLNEWMTVLKTLRVFDEKKGCTLDTQAGSVPRTITEEPELKARELSKMTTFRSLIMYN